MQLGCVESVQLLDGEHEQLGRSSIVCEQCDELCMLFLPDISCMRHACIKLRDRLPRGLNTSICEGRLLDRLFVAGDQTNQHLGLVLLLIASLIVIRPFAVIFTLFRFGQGHHLIDHRDVLPLSANELNFISDTELHGVFGNRRSSSITRPVIGALMDLQQTLLGAEA